VADASGPVVAGVVARTVAGVVAPVAGLVVPVVAGVVAPVVAGLVVPVVAGLVVPVVAGPGPIPRAGTARPAIARRLSSVSGLYAYLVARGDTPVRVNPVPRGLMTRRQGGTMRSRMAPLVRVPRTLPRVLSAEEAGRLVGALRTHRDRAMVLGMLLAGLRRCEVLGLRFADVQVADRRLVVVEGKGGHHRVVPAANGFFDALGAYLHGERPETARTDRVFVVLKGPRRGLPLSAEGLDEILDGARRRAGLDHATCHQLRHTCLTRLREAGMALEAVQAQAGHASIESTRVYLHLANDWLADQYLRAAELIDADTAAVAEMLAVQKVAAR
jgi:integrase/recombinase XerD